MAMIEAAENGVICAILTSEKGLRAVSKLKPEDFDGRDTKAIFGAIVEIYNAGKTPDIVGVSEMVGAELAVKAGEIMRESFAPIALIDQNIEAIKNASNKRKLATAFSQAQKELTESKSAIECKLNVMQKLSEICADIERENEDLDEIAPETLSEVRRRIGERGDTSRYIGLPDIDSITGGLFEDEMTILAARPGTGKTAFALQVATTFSQKGRTVQFFSREMGRTQLGLRLFARQTPIDGRKLRTGRIDATEEQQLEKTLEQIRKLPLYINTGARNPMELREVCRERTERGFLDLVVIDYLQMLSGVGKFGSREQEVSYLSRSIKELATEFHVPVLCLSQLNRDGDQRQPILRDLRESGSIEQDADNVMFLHEPTEKQLRGAELEILRKVQKNGNKYIQCILAKMRQGETGLAPLQYIPKHLSFSCIARAPEWAR